MHAVSLGRVRAVDRLDYVLSTCRQRSVLHLGCVDHPFLTDRLVRGELLHAALATVARELVGVDRDQAGIEALREAGFRDLYVGDAEDLRAVGLDRSFEVILAGELLEHLTNPGELLRSLPSLMAPGGELLVTVPSAQSIRIVANTLRSREHVHPDHKAYYSPHTLTALLEAHGFQVVEMLPYWTPARVSPPLLAAFDRVLRLGRRVNPWLGEGLVARACLVRTPR